jgi:hypothetical protein
MNSKRIPLYLLLITSLFLFSSCLDWFGTTGKGNIVTQNVTATNFQNIELLNAANVDIIKGDTFEVQISDYENIIQNLSVAVVNHNLVISTIPIGTILLNSKAHVTIIMKDSLNAVAIAGSGNVNLNSPFKDLNTTILTGSGNIFSNENLNINQLNASILGSGNISAKGNVNSLTGLISGSGNLNFSNLIAKKASCTISGSGTMNVNVTDSLKALITGSGSIKYKGNPIISSTITGSGVVSPN